MRKLVLFLLLFAYNAFSQPADVRVVLSGTTTDSTIREVVLSKYNPFLDIYAPIIVSKSSIGNDNDFLLDFNAAGSQILNLSIKGESWNIYVSPGSSQRFEIANDGEKKKVTFYGDNAGNSEFLNELNVFFRVNKIKTPSYPSGTNLLDYKAKIDSFYNIRTDFLNGFASGKFVDKVLFSELMAYQYQFLLDAPLRSNPKVQLPADYVKNMHNLVVSDQKLIYYDLFSDYLRSRFILSKSKRGDIRSNFSDLYKEINLRTDGKINDFLVASLIGFYVTNASSRDTSAIFEDVIKEAKVNIEDPIYSSYLLDKYTEYKYLNKQFPDHVLDGTILISYKDKQRKTLRDFIDEYRGSSIYVDFWASWCGPCRFDIQESGASKAVLSAEKIHLVYLSLDKNQKSWEKAVIEENIINNQYLIQGGIESELVKYYNISSIPRYFFLDKDHRLKDPYAPRLGKSHLENLQRAIKNEKIQVTTYK